MHPLTRALLSSWELRPDVLAVILPLGALYVLGWRCLRAQSVNRKLATHGRLIAYLSGLGFVALALMSPIDRLGSELFFMHMTQHMLLMMFAAPLLLLANPFPFIVWALPPRLRVPVAGLFSRDSWARRGLATVTRPDVTWLTYVVVVTAWHDANLYNAALRYDWVHNLQHISFFTVSALYWWPIIGPAPHVRRSFVAWGKLVYLIGSVPPNMLLGISIAFASNVIYTYYETVPRIWSFSVMQDQQLAGAIMWIQGSEMFILAALVVLARLFGRKGKDKRSPRRELAGRDLSQPS